VDIEHDFWEQRIDTSTRKLLFTDVIYDFETDSFSAAFDPSVVFRGRISRPYNPNPSPQAVEWVLKSLWQDPFTPQQLAEDVPLFDRISLARALAGEYRARKAYFRLGNTGTGKGVIIVATTKSCGDYCGEFSLQAFEIKKSLQDAAKQLSWVKMLVGKRLEFSSEAPVNATLNGALFKAMVSGGDGLTVRSNFTDEVRQCNRAVLFVFANDLPRFNPCDDAVLDRIGGVLDMQVQFLERPDPANPLHRPLDMGLKDRFDEPEAQDAFLALLLDAYRVFRRHGHAPPPSVLAAVGEWVVSESSLRTTLEENFVFTSSEDDYVPCSDLERFVVQEKGLSYSKNKLGRELTRLGLGLSVKTLSARTVNVRTKIAFV
jgi:phage/plasmid-associated DNA primase